MLVRFSKSLPGREAVREFGKGAQKQVGYNFYCRIHLFIFSQQLFQLLCFFLHHSQYNPTLSVYLLTLLHPDILLWKYIMSVILDPIKSSLLCIEAISSREPNYLLSLNVIFSVVSRTSPASDPIPQDPRLSKVIFQMSNVRIFSNSCHLSFSLFPGVVQKRLDKTTYYCLPRIQGEVRLDITEQEQTRTAI